MNEPLPPPDCHHAAAAEGWIELGNWREAQAELEQIRPAQRGHPHVLGVRWQLHACARDWALGVEVAEAALARAPHQADAWIHRSFALHELKRTQEAFDLLLPAVGRFPTVWTIPYNLACYCAQLGLLPESRQWLDQAMQIDAASVQRAAAEDPDLNPLRESLGGLLPGGAG